MAEQFKIELCNRFEVLAEVYDAEEKWSRLKKVIIDSSESTVGRRRGTYRERWIQERTWVVIDERRHARQRRDQAKTNEDRLNTATAYRELDRRVKRSCRRDKRDWLDQKGHETQVGAEKNDMKTLYQHRP